MKYKWFTEPKEKKFISNGYKCHIKRHPTMLHLCGYVSIPNTHPLFGKGYYELYEQGVDINVHGGLTYAQQKGNSWVFGFDCAHLGDLVPTLISILGDSGDTYRDMEYVEKETKNLARQLKEYQKSNPILITNQ